MNKMYLGLGTSSILAGAVMAVLWRASGKAFDVDSLNHAVCITASLLCLWCLKYENSFNSVSPYRVLYGWL